mgnify:CR=1 FL=1
MNPILLRGLILQLLIKIDTMLTFQYPSYLMFLVPLAIPTKFQVKTRILTWDMKKNIKYLILMRATVCGVKHLQIFLFFCDFHVFPMLYLFKY